MRTKKTLSTEIKAKLDQLSPESQATYLNLFLSSNDAGFTVNSHNVNLLELQQNGLIQVTKDHIVLNGYIGANYGRTIRPDYSPTKGVFETIKEAGYSYNPANNEIQIPESLLITSFDSLNKPIKVQTSTNVSNETEKTVQATEISQSPIISFIGSINFALYLSIALMISQSIHTANTLMHLSHLPSPSNEIAAIFTALIMDSLIIYFIVNGKVFQSSVFFLFCSLMGLYSYHINTVYWTYQSFFSIVVSVGIPFAIHSVSSQVNKSSSHHKSL